MVIEIEKHTEAAPEDEGAQDKVAPETIKNLAASATGARVETNNTLDESDFDSAETVLATPPSKEAETRQGEATDPSQRRLGTAAAARSVVIAKDGKKGPKVTPKATTVPVPEAASPTPDTDVGGDGNKQPPEKPRQGAEDDGEKRQPKAKKVHETLSTALEQVGERHGYYNRIVTEIDEEQVMIESEQTYLTGTRKARTQEEAEGEHREILKEGKAITIAKFTCPENEIDENEKPVESYTYLTAPPKYLDTDLHEQELATFLGTSEEEVFRKNGEFFDENRHVMTPAELSQAVDKSDADLATPATFVRTTYREADQEERLEVLKDDDTSQLAHQRRLDDLEWQLSRMIKKEPAEEKPEIPKKPQEKLGKELYLTPAEEANINEDKRLIQGYREGDQALATQLAERHKGIVWETVRDAFAKHPTARLDFEDGLQEAYLALFKAAETWDPSLGVPFVNYGGNEARWAISHLLDEQAHLVRLTPTATKFVYQIRITNLIRQQEGKLPLTDEEVSELTGAPLEKKGNKITVAEIRRAEALTAGLGSYGIEDQVYYPGTDIYTSPEQAVSKQQHPRVTPLTGQQLEDMTNIVLDKIILAEVIDRYLQIDVSNLLPEWHERDLEKRKQELRWLTMHAGAVDAPMNLNRVAKAVGMSRSVLVTRLERYRDKLRQRITNPNDPET
jgi:RNA polymerase sigma factor (sigma-70 family)